MIAALCAAVGVGVSGGASIAAVTADQAEVRHTAVRMAAGLLRDRYVSPEGGAALADALRAREGELLNDSAKVDDAAFAARISEAMRVIVPDYHLRFLPPGYRSPMRVVRPEGGQTPQSPSPGQREAPDVDIRLLPSKIGYMRVSPLVSLPATVAEVEARMAGLATADALIYDVRGVPGGDPTMVSILSGYAFDRATRLIDTQVRGDPVIERWTRAAMTGPRFATAPVAVLIDGRAASAAEALAFGLKVTGRARLFGERTRGAGNTGGVVPLAGGFALWLPTGRSFDPRTGKGWDGVGVEPDHAVSSGQALEAAQTALLALVREGQG